MTWRRVSGGPPCCALANAPTLSDYFSADSTHSVGFKDSREIRSNSQKNYALTSPNDGTQKNSVTFLRTASGFP